MKLRAIILGTLADIAGTHLFLLALVLMLLDPGSSSQAPILRINSSLLDAMCMVWGLFFTGVGGYVAGRLAPHAPLLNGAAMGLASLTFSHMCYGWTPGEVGVPLYTAGTLLSMVVAVLGARLSRRGGWILPTAR
jgi:hypothetical protein